MTTLLIIRHGQSVANLDNMFAGHMDVPLSALGEKQAKLTADYIAENYKVDAVYASDLSRAYATGEQVAKAFNLPITKDKGLREIYAGDWEGKHHPDLPKLFPIEFGVWMQDIGKAVCPSGESVLELQQRLVATLRRIAKENEGKTVAVASHACAIRSVMSYCVEQGVEHMNDIPWVSNASVTIIEVENGIFRLIQAGLDEHLCDFSGAIVKNV